MTSIDKIASLIIARVLNDNNELFLVKNARTPIWLFILIYCLSCRINSLLFKFIKQFCLREVKFQILKIIFHNSKVLTLKFNEIKLKDNRTKLLKINGTGNTYIQTIKTNFKVPKKVTKYETENLSYQN